MPDLLRQFFTYSFENSINKQMLNYDYVLPEEDVFIYLKNICQLDIKSIIDYISKSERIGITAKDIFQFSEFSDCTDNLCKVLINENNPGVSHLSAGRLLLNDGINRNEVAYTKYGENHLKTAESLGLVFNITNTYFLSCIGAVWPKLSEQDKEDLLVRLVLRSKLVSRLIQASENGKVNLRQFLYMISDKTYIRRRSNIRKIIHILEYYKSFDFSAFTSSIIY